MSLRDLLIAVAGGIGKVRLSKVGANIVENLPKLISSYNISDLEEENKFYCPNCGTSIEHGRVVCLGCKADVIYGKTQEETDGESLVNLSIVGIIAFIVLVVIPKCLNFLFNLNIALGFGLGKYSLYLALLITFCTGILCILYQKDRGTKSRQRIRCRRYNHFSKEPKSYKDRDVEY